jgi:hypothetical protein
MTTSGPASNGGGPNPGQQLTLFAVDSPVSRSAMPGLGSARRTSGGFGRRSWPSFARYDPGGRCWRTSQLCLDGELGRYSATWPRSGMTRNGTAYPLPPSAPLTDVTDGSPWPTPRATDGDRGGRGDLLAMVRTGKGSRRKNWPTPRAQNGEPRNHTVWRRPDGQPQNLENAVAAADPSAIGGQLNPGFVEWLMGFPKGWTEVD